MCLYVGFYYLLDYFSVSVRLFLWGARLKIGSGINRGGSSLLPTTPAEMGPERILISIFDVVQCFFPSAFQSCSSSGEAVYRLSYSAHKVVRCINVYREEKRYLPWNTFITLQLTNPDCFLFLLSTYSRAGQK